MSPRSKWLDPRRIAHGLRWRLERVLARYRTGYRHPGLSVPEGDQFRRAVLDHYGVERVEDLDPTHRMWADFTLTSTERGINAVQALGGRPRFRGKRVLDVGCAAGGFLVAARRAGAKEVVGIDSDPRAMELAPLLLADHGVRAQLHIADLTQPGLADQLGEFDLVLCNDVLEHVQDIESAVDHLGQLLAPRGRLFLEIPNGSAIAYVRSDGHYKLPGITLLDFDDARRWHNAFFPEKRYDTYYYASLDFYVVAFSRVGILLRMVNVPNADPSAITELAAELKELQLEFASLPARLPDKPHDLILLIQERAAQYAQELAARLRRYQCMNDPQEMAVLGTALLSTYEVGNWVFEGYKLSRD